MVGIPDDILQQHDQMITQKYWEEAAERHAATGNVPGSTQAGPKKAKFDTKENIKARLAAMKARKAAGELGTSSGGATPMEAVQQGQTPPIMVRLFRLIKRTPHLPVI